MITSLSEASRLSVIEWNQRTSKPIEVTKEVYWEALGALPPYRMEGDAGFWLGEPWTHDRHDNPVCLYFIEQDNKFLCWMRVYPQAEIGSHYQARKHEIIIALRNAIHDDNPQLVSMFEAIQDWYHDISQPNQKPASKQQYTLLDAIADTLEGRNPYWNVQ